MARDAKIVRIFARTVVRSAQFALMNSVLPVISARSVQARTCGAKIAICAEIAVIYVLTAEQFAMTVPNTGVKTVIDVETVRQNTARTVVSVSNVRT